MTRQDRIFIIGSWVVLTVVLGGWAFYYAHQKARLDSRYAEAIREARAIVDEPLPAGSVRATELLRRAASTDPRRKEAWELLLLTEARWEALYGRDVRKWADYLQQLRSTGTTYTGDEEYAEAMALHALAASQQNRTDALYLIQKALSHRPGSPSLRTARALILVELGAADRALKELKGIATPYARLVRAGAYLELGMASEARKELETTAPQLAALLDKCSLPPTPPPAVRFMAGVCEGDFGEPPTRVPVFLLIHATRLAMAKAPTMALSYWRRAKELLPSVRGELRTLEARVMVAAGEPGQLLDGRYPDPLRHLASVALYGLSSKDATATSILASVFVPKRTNSLVPPPSTVDLASLLREVSAITDPAMATTARYGLATMLGHRCLVEGNSTIQARRRAGTIRDLVSRFSHSFLGNIALAWASWCEGNTKEARHLVSAACFHDTEQKVGCPTPWGNRELHFLYVLVNTDPDDPPQNFDEVVTWALDHMDSLPQDEQDVARARLAAVQMVYMPGKAEEIAKRTIRRVLRGRSLQQLPAHLLSDLLPLMVVGGTAKSARFDIRAFLTSGLWRRVRPAALLRASRYLMQMGDGRGAEALISAALLPRRQALKKDFATRVLEAYAIASLLAGDRDAWKRFEGLRLSPEGRAYHAMALARARRCAKAVELAMKLPPEHISEAIDVAITCQDRDAALAMYRKAEKTQYQQSVRARLEKRGWLKR